MKKPHTQITHITAVQKEQVISSQDIPAIHIISFDRFGITFGTLFKFSPWYSMKLTKDPILEFSLNVTEIQ